MNNAKAKLVIVEWGDAWGRTGWSALENAISAHKPLKIVSVGFVIEEDKKGISLADCYDENLNPGSQHFIPRGMIKKITKVKY